MHHVIRLDFHFVMKLNISVESWNLLFVYLLHILATVNGRHTTKDIYNRTDISVGSAIYTLFTEYEVF